MTADKRPDPKTRKHPRLWQAYLWWREMNEMRKRHTLRISSIERGKSNLDADYEQLILDSFPYANAIDDDGNKLWNVEEVAKREMVAYGKQVGKVWDWLVGIKGIGEPSAAKILAQFDDVGKFDTVSRFWRFAGWGLYDYWMDDKGNPVAPKAGYKWVTRDGEREKVWTIPDPQPGWTLKRMIDRRIPGWHSPYNALLKSEVWLIVTNFVRHQTPVYVDEYYAEKERQRKNHPETVNKNGRTKFTDGHIDNRAKRKVAKIFLQHLWVTWRELEGLSVTLPYAQRILKHDHYIEPEPVK